MPRVTEEYREARRDEIARAAVRVLERKGVRDTSIADIVAESGLSTGAIYSHFSNKSELARYIAGRFVFVRVDRMDAAAAAGAVVAPRDILRHMLGGILEGGISPQLVLQFWGEAMVDPEIHEELMRTAARLRESLSAAVAPWVRARAQPGADVDAEVAATARTITSLAQGFIANSAVFGARTFEDYLAGIDAALAR